MTDNVSSALTYALGLLSEECGEALCHIGRAQRFGIDTLGQDGISERDGLTKELGDIRAAITFAIAHGLVDEEALRTAEISKVAKLFNPDARDNLGRQLAPQPEYSNG